MANEARSLELYGENSNGKAGRATINTTNAIAYGALLERRGDLTASLALAFTANETTSGAFIGICSREKVAGDDIAETGFFRDLCADLKASGAITINTPVYCAGNNEIRSLPTAMNLLASSVLGIQLLNSMMVGIAEETASDGEIIRVRINK